MTDEVSFITQALHNLAGTWNNATLSGLAALQVPENVLGRRRSLLRADINEQWAIWFIESLADPRRYAGNDVSYAFLFRDVLTVVDQRFHTFTKPEKKRIASTVARILQQRVLAFQAKRQRQPVSRSEKISLIELAGSSPRCWLCGWQFTKEAIDNFIQQGRREIPLPKFIDFLKPRGLKQRDLSIEIDHVVAHVHGGENEGNLRLACGWCNRYKSALTSIYDVEGRPRQVKPNNLGINSLPQPFWIVRLLATERVCEHPEGCDCSADDSEMTIAPICNGGALNPSNLRVTCYSHDNLGSIRFQPSRVVRQLWGLSD
ncbi:HNH endonuclease [Desulfatirhabdium butyrativorans]|uniref:HNH endonuclease n=1 Tax=Desulfatirhabdium butyrativorans TaxID=340467 RepID=UPI00040BCE08|nr:HNH endonuclease [Desulfatirhabdium butyrativorans]